MERLTYLGENGKNYVKGNAYYNHCRYRLDEVAARLAAYEDTGLEPCDYKTMKAAMEQCEEAKKQLTELIGIIGGRGFKRIRELAEADNEGRLVVLPCKVGDTVWYRTYTKNATVDLGMKPHKVIALSAYVVTEGEFASVGVPVEHFGKSAFLAREEAERALKEGDDG